MEDGAPERIAEDDDFILSVGLFALLECSAQRRSHAEDMEKVRAYRGLVYLLLPGRSLHPGVPFVEIGERRERCVFLPLPFRNVGMKCPGGCSVSIGRVQQ